MPDEDAPDVQRTMQAIRRYVASHPAAADSAAGVAQWWLAPMGLDMPLSTVRAALQALVDAGAVQARALPDGRTLYAAGGPAQG